MQTKTNIVSCHTASSKPVKQEVNSTVILPCLLFPMEGLSTVELLVLISFDQLRLNSKHYLNVVKQVTLIRRLTVLSLRNKLP